MVHRLRPLGFPQRIDMHVEHLLELLASEPMLVAAEAHDFTRQAPAPPLPAESKCHAAFYHWVCGCMDESEQKIDDMFVGEAFGIFTSLDSQSCQKPGVPPHILGALAMCRGRNSCKIRGWSEL